MAVSRRRFLGGSAAAVGAVGAARLSGGLALAAPGTAPTAEEVSSLSVPVMLSVVDAARGEFEILVGETAVPFTDRSLVAKLARAARSHRNVVAS